MNGWTATVSKFHDPLKQAMKPFQGTQLETSAIRKIIENTSIMAHDSQFILPSDHCINHTNKGACTCALTGGAIFEQTRRGLYYVRKFEQ